MQLQHIPGHSAEQVEEIDRFRKALEKAIGRGITVAAIAKHLETSAARVEKWRKDGGEKLPHPDYCSAIAHVLDRMQ